MAQYINIVPDNGNIIKFYELKINCLDIDKKGEQEQNNQLPRCLFIEAT
jgi:hypothetical protein